MDTETGSVYVNCNARRTALQQDLNSGARIDGGADFLSWAFKDVVPRRTITRFLTQSRSYDMGQRRWRTLPSNASTEEELTSKIHQVMKEIFKYKHFAAEDRKLVSCDDHEVKFKKSDLCSHEIDPEFMILGRGGRSFREQKFPPSPAYSQCVSIIGVTPNSFVGDLQSHITLTATYAQQCFIEQHNRIKVYAALITETSMWLFQYDRGGITYSSSCNIHDDPHTFVRILLGLASDGAQVGFDTSIFWEGGKRWITTRNQKGRRVTYLIQGDGPISQRQTLIGCATRCWRVMDPYSKKVYIIKDAWRLMQDDPESHLLEIAEGLPGVGQLVAAEEDFTKTTPHLRGCRSSDFLPTDRAWCRMILEAYGDGLQAFIDGLHLLEAYRDIVVALLDLWERGILHRDISINNVLFGKASAPLGSRGVVIDLDRAIRIDTKESLLGATPQIGTRGFQSISVLSSDALRKEAPYHHDAARPYPHDHLDDLESLFYVLCCVCYHFECPGITASIPDGANIWESREAHVSATSKLLFLMHPLPPLSEYFQRGSAFPHLFERLQQQFLKIAQEKRKGTHAVIEGENLKEVFRNARRDFEAVLGYVDQAIEEWKRDVRDPPKPPPSPRRKPVEFATSEEIAQVKASSNTPQGVASISGEEPNNGRKRAHIDSNLDEWNDPASPSKKRRLSPTPGVKSPQISSISIHEPRPSSPPSRRLRERKKSHRS